MGWLRGENSRMLFREPPSVLWRRGNARINWGQSISIQVIIIVIIFVVGVIVLIIIVICTCIALQENLVGRFLSLRAQTLSFDLASRSPARLASFRSRKMSQHKMGSCKQCYIVTYLKVGNLKSIDTTISTNLRYSQCCAGSMGTSSNAAQPRCLTGRSLTRRRRRRKMVVKERIGSSGGGRAGSEHQWRPERWAKNCKFGMSTAHISKGCLHK